MQHYGDNFVPVVPDEHLLHTQEQPLCGDPTCLCYEDNDTLAAIHDAIIAGTITAHDAQRMIKGQTV
jgi:hypothetical protein